MLNFKSFLNTAWPTALRLVFVSVMCVFLLVSNSALAANSSPRAEGSINTVYILDSKITRTHFEKLGLNKKIHTGNLARFANFFDKMHYRHTRIDGNQISKLPINSILLVLDSVALSTEDINDIIFFVNRGGSLLFNHMAGFYNTKGAWRGDAFVNAITGLKYNPETSKTVDYKGHFLTARILSPLTEYFNQAKRLSLIAYQEIPFFRNQTPNEPDMILTNWSRTKTPEDRNNIEIPLVDSGVLWHDNKNNGRWVYFNLPSNIFNLKDHQAKDFEQLLQGMVDFLSLPAQGRLLPYLDMDSATVIFANVEQQYENLNNLIDLAGKYNVPMSTYHLAKMAQQQPKIIQRSQLSPLIEVGSHSFTLGAIIEQPKTVLKHEIANSKAVLESPLKPVLGFRPPRQEFDIEMVQVIKDAGYDYIFAGVGDTLYPKMLNEELIQLPKLGSDDYEFFINKKMSPGRILHTAIKEENIARVLNGAYTLGVHTHIMLQPDRIYILDAILQKITADPKINIITAEDLARRVRKVRQIDTRLVSNNNSHEITLTNNNSTGVRHLVYRLYWQGGTQPKNISTNNAKSDVLATHYVAQKYSDIHLWGLAAGESLTISAR